MSDPYPNTPSLPNIGDPNGWDGERGIKGSVDPHFVSLGPACVRTIAWFGSFSRLARFDTVNSFRSDRFGRRAQDKVKPCVEEFNLPSSHHGSPGHDGRLPTWAETEKRKAYSSLEDMDRLDRFDTRAVCLSIGIIT
ncbi:hypothetical protein CRG98_030624 [Punica granatum]|uniref:Uncharacterized protein n=1 Tax=Punica granatum TaxID=22663 RepID=A0A2I0IYE8_PUNGR|nr:hypothetical protein CRG98_030624 [Punica granatum]